MANFCLIFLLAFQLACCLAGEPQDSENLDFTARSCFEVRQNNDSAVSGLYEIYSKYDIPYTVFCDMESKGGGWTLVASIHENNYSNYGKCTTGDRWSSENGQHYKYFDSNWENTNTFGQPDYATSDDYKNRAYFELEAKRMMVIQVPNDTPMTEYISAAEFQYYTQNQFLQEYGGNLRELFKGHPLRDDYYSYQYDNGPSSEISFLKGSASVAHDQFTTTAQSETENGYMQFRAITTEQAVAAFCPYGKMYPNTYNAEYACFGISSPDISSGCCGDFSCIGSNSIIYSSFLIFYR